MGKATYGNGERCAFGSGANASDIAKFDLHIVSCQIVRAGSKNRLADAHSDRGTYQDGHSRLKRREVTHLCGLLLDYNCFQCTQFFVI